MSSTFEFSDLSKELTSIISKTHKKQHGIYFTPPQTVSKCINLIKPYFTTHDNKTIRVLEPSCGSGEFLREIHNIYHNNHSNHNTQHSSIICDCIEFDKTIFEQVSQKYTDSKYCSFHFMNQNFITHTTTNYDLIIGNPPYYVMKKTNVPDEFTEYFTGRPNIFILFIIKSLQLLSDNGILCFVLPKNFLNCIYYDKTRKYISEHFEILNIQDCSGDYIDTKQETVLFIVRNSSGTDNSKFILHKNNYTIFGKETDITYLKSLYVGSKTLNQLGFNVKVGNITWNQVKDTLTDDATYTRLIYSSNIKNNSLQPPIQFKNPEKKNFIILDGWDHPSLVVNRGYGVGEYKFEYAIIDIEQPYLIENHLIYIIPNTIEHFSRAQLIQKYNSIVRSLQNEKTSNFVKVYFGNNAINTTELCNILPIYDI